MKCSSQGEAGRSPVTPGSAKRQWVAGERPGWPGHLGQVTQARKLRESGEGLRPDHCVGWGGETGRRLGVEIELEVQVGRKEIKTISHLSSTRACACVHALTQTHTSMLTASSQSHSLLPGPSRVPRPALIPLGPLSCTGTHPS